MPSTVIRTFLYHARRSELEVTFTTGRRYLYFRVPPRVVEEFRAAPSKGRFFNARIRDHYDYRELEPEIS
jgi:KTSC domain-containing protein